MLSMPRGFWKLITISHCYGVMHVEHVANHHYSFHGKAPRLTKAHSLPLAQSETCGIVIISTCPFLVIRFLLFLLVEMRGKIKSFPELSGHLHNAEIDHLPSICCRS